MVYSVLKSAGAFPRWNRAEGQKGTIFQLPRQVHEHWQIDISNLNVRGTFYYLISVLDGASRYLVQSDVRESMRESDVEIVFPRARESFPHVQPCITSNNGLQFISKDVKEFIRMSGMIDMRTSPYYPQSNGRIERWHGSLKRE